MVESWMIKGFFHGGILDKVSRCGAEVSRDTKLFSLAPSFRGTKSSFVVVI